MQLNSRRKWIQYHLHTASWCSFSSAAPCAPQALSVKRMCDIEGVLVSWARSNLAQSYYLTATGWDGDVQSCSSTTENCTLSRLHCGQPYTLNVSASDGNCTSPASQALTVNASETHTIIYSMYTISSQSTDYTEGQRTKGYNFSVYCISYCIQRKHGMNLDMFRSWPCNIMTICHSCNLLPVSFFSNTSACAALSSAPCVPLSLNVSMSCGNNSATLSWSSSNGSVSYYASAINAQGDKSQCNTTNTSCTIAGLQCGISYNFSVQASDAVCNSTSSPVVQKGIGN